MPLVKSSSKAAFKENVRREIAADKPVKQAVAIAYSVKRKAGGSKVKSKSHTHTKHAAHHAEKAAHHAEKAMHHSKKAHDGHKAVSHAKHKAKSK